MSNHNLKIAVLVAALFAVSSAYAGGNNNQNNSDTINNYGDVNNYTNPSANAIGVGVGIGYSTATGGAGGQGGSANSLNLLNNNTDVRNTNTLANNNDVRNTVNNNTDVRNTNTNLNSDTNVNSNSQGQGQQQGQGQVQGQEANANNEGNHQTVVFQGSKSYRPPVSTAVAPTIFPTAPCMGSTSGGATGTLFSISGGSSWTSSECMILETARSFDQAGYAEDGLAVRCQGQWAKAAPSCKALEEKNKPAPVAKAVTKVEAKSNLPKPKLVATKDLASKVNTPAVSDNGYYSVVTNPLGQ